MEYVVCLYKTKKQNTKLIMCAKKEEKNIGMYLCAKGQAVNIKNSRRD